MQQKEETLPVIQEVMLDYQLCPVLCQKLLLLKLNPGTCSQSKNDENIYYYIFLIDDKKFLIIFSISDSYHIISAANLINNQFLVYQIYFRIRY